ncbi:Hsp20 family protein [Acinetobacter junii]|jgi:molecular chaperone IbpA|uniref:Hsp20 family protein n=1 Tax=Acinetobacter junii TaxID=40215 RepID=UPI000F7F61DE|nr:Hsp20 family protein [Acinetobacter junii]RTE46865.1 Hsp20 family protein [Acinetobacter junii]USR72848.1 Hsp20 family protein [Acinetobacter junii]
MSNLNLHPLFRRSIGFDRLNDFIDYAMQSDTPNYPPYNIEKSGENRYRIVVATAGFSLEELGLSLENQLLTISGKPEVVQTETTEYLHKGIARRAFKLSLRLDEHIEVQQADYENGLLVIELERIIPEEKLPREIPIGKKKLLLDQPDSTEKTVSTQ